MDPSATLLSLLHKNPASPSETTMTGQRSPTTTPSYPSSQPTPPPNQSSPSSMPIFSYAQPFTQPLAYNSTVFPPATVPPPPPPPPPPPLSSQSQQMSPNPIASLLQTLNTSSISSPSQATSISASGTPQPQQILIPFGGENEVTTSTGTGDPTLLNIDKASTESLKLALFGHPSSTASFDERYYLFALLMFDFTMMTFLIIKNFQLIAISQSAGEQKSIFNRYFVASK
jgi:hypothetical protein